VEFPNFLSLFIFGFFQNLASPILLDISKYFEVSPENMNLITTFYMIGIATGTIALLFINRKFNKTIVMISSHILAIPTLIGLSLVTSLKFFYLLYFISGFLFGIIFINANSSMIEGRVKNKDSVVNLGHVFAATGIVIGLFLASSLVNRQINWKFMYFIVIILISISLLLNITISKKVKFNLLSVQNNISIKELFSHKDKNVYLLFTVILILFYAISEVTVSSWAPTFFRIDRMFDLYSSSLVVSIFWIGILVGRLIVSFLSYKFKADSLLIGLSIISIIGLVFVVFLKNQNIIFIGAGIVGIGFSAIGPLLISSAGGIFNTMKEIPITILFITAWAGSALSPFLIKLVVSYNLVISIAMVILFMGIFIIFVLGRKYYKGTSNSKEIQK
jgi:MFS transporter, FHS family, glucose/mannose:H+ symporter